MISVVFMWTWQHQLDLHSSYLSSKTSYFGLIALYVVGWRSLR